MDPPAAEGPGSGAPRDGAGGASAAGGAAAPGPAPATALRAQRWAGALRDWSPAAIFFGAVFQKEVRVLGRQRSTYIARFGFVAGVLVIGSLIYLAAGSEMDGTRSALEQLQAMQNVAPVLAIMAAFFQLLAVVAIAGGLLAPAIVEERQKRSLSALATTPLTPAQVVGGKLSGRLTQVLVLVLSMLPFFLALRLLGGLEARFIVESTAVVVSSGFLAASLALLASCFVRKPGAASAFSFVSLVLLSATPMIVAAVLAMFGRFGLPPAWSMAVSPVMALVDSSWARGTVWSTSTATNLLLASVACGLATARIPAVYRAADLVTVDTRRRGERRSRIVGDRPVLWRELRGGPARRGWVSRFRMFLPALAVVLVGLGVLWGDPSDIGQFISITIIVSLVIVFSAAGSASSAVIGEVEARTWATLMTTPLLPAEILWSKLAGALRRVAFLPTTYLAYAAVAVVQGAASWTWLPVYAMVIGPTVAVLSAAGLLMSVVSRKAAVANTRAMLILVGWLMGIPMAMGVLSLVAALAGLSGPRVTEPIGFVLSLNPMVLIGIGAAGSAVGDGSAGRFAMPWGSSLDELEFIAFVAAVAAGHLAVAWGLMRVAAAAVPRSLPAA